MVNSVIVEGKHVGSFQKNYCQLSIASLIKLIVEDSDRRAINKLSTRIIYVKDSQGMNIPEYINYLKESKGNQYYENIMIKEKAYDITMAKFYNLPENLNGGIDCRYYYKAFLEYIVPKLERRNMLQREAYAAKALKQFIDRHFKWSILDAKRKENGFVRNYTWNTESGSYRINMPSVMTGRQCSNWLNDNIGISDSNIAFERDRIQQRVNERLFVPVKLSADADNCSMVSSKEPLPLSQVIDSELGKQSLADCIADEKADNLDSLRPSVAMIGGDNVRNLVKDIFEDISNDRYQPSLLAEKYNISPASMTRFASIKWSRNSSNMPQLWQNLARYVVNSSKYSELLDQTRLSGRLLLMVKE